MPESAQNDCMSVALSNQNDATQSVGKTLTPKDSNIPALSSHDNDINQEPDTGVCDTAAECDRLLAAKQDHEAATADDVFGRLQEENAKLPPQDSTNFILAQIERQNHLLEKDPKSIFIQSNQLRAHFSTVQRLVTDNMLPASEQIAAEEEQIDWNFWEAVIQDFDRVALKTPHLLSVKLRNGIPSRLRGLIWQAMSKSASLHLETVYDQLCRERSPHERIIQRDLARTFPCIEMFKQENGEGQLAMRRILEAYSLYDTHVGYCQGLAFLVGPLLMHMPEMQAFCVFVRLMETYEMRSMFTLEMEGLQMRLYQFSHLLRELLPELAEHLERHGVHAAMYASQWFLTLFAYAFPISLVTRIYDIVFAEGAAETIMRVAIAMLKRSQDKIMEETEFEHLLDYVTSRKLCEPYADDDAQVIRDASSLSNVITRSKMDALAEQYEKQGQRREQQQQQQQQQEARFWRLRKPKKAATRNKKRWSSTSTTSQETLKNERQRFSLDQAERALTEMSAKYQQLLEELAELKMDKQDAESERDALKMTILELEKRRYRKKKTSRRTLYQCHCAAEEKETPADELLLLDDTDSMSSGSSSSSTVMDSFSDATSQSIATMATEQQQDDAKDEEQQLRIELVRLKVENFELKQQNEKMAQELEDLEERFETVNEGQLALVEKLVMTKADMDELLKEKKAKDLEWLEVVQQNELLKQELARIKNIVARLTCDDLSAKGSVGEKAAVDFTTVSPVERRPASLDLRRAGLTRSTSLYGRVWHALSQHSMNNS